MKLTDRQIRAFKPAPKPKKLSDGSGLWLLLTPHGSKPWRLAYRYGGKQKTLTFGSYPMIGLADAREQREEAKRTLSRGLDPMAERKASQAAEIAMREHTFSAMAVRPTSASPARRLRSTAWQVKGLPRAIDIRCIDPAATGFSATWTIPLMTLRSSTRSLPRVSVGK